MKLWQKYLRPKSVTEALHMLETSPDPACPIAGGTDLILEIQQGRLAPVHTMVDLNDISELTTLEIRNGQLFIGAAVPISRIALSNLAREHVQALVDACNLIGGPQVRNVATLGGNIAHALPAADGTIALLALDAQAEVADSRKRRRVPIASLFVGPGKSSLRIGREILVGFTIPLKTPHQGSAFKRIMRDQGIALPILNLAVWLEVKLNHISEVRIAIGPSGPVPQRINTAENVLRNQSFNTEACNEAIAAILNQVNFCTSPYRASKEYRQELVGVLLREALDASWQRANSS